MTVPPAAPNFVPRPPKPGVTANWALFAGSIGSLIVGVLSIANPKLWNIGGILGWMTDSANPLPVVTGLVGLTVVLAPLVALAAGIFGFVTRSRKLFVALTLANFFLLYFLDLILEIAWAAGADYFNFRYAMYVLFPVFTDFGITSLAKFLVLVTVVFAAISLLIKPREPKPSMTPIQPIGAPIVPSAAPADSDAPLQTFASYSPSVAPGATVASAPSQLPIFALIGAFVVPLAGIIMGHIALSQMNKGQISSQNRTMAIAGLALGYVFMAFGLVASIILVIVVISNPYLFGGY